MKLRARLLDRRYARYVAAKPEHERHYFPTFDDFSKLHGINVSIDFGQTYPTIGAVSDQQLVDDELWVVIDVDRRHAALVTQIVVDGRTSELTFASRYLDSECSEHSIYELSFVRSKAWDALPSNVASLAWMPRRALRATPLGAYSAVSFLPTCLEVTAVGYRRKWLGRSNVTVAEKGAHHGKDAHE